MRILLITLYFLDPTYVGALRWRRMSKYLRDLGWEIDVLTLGPLCKVGNAADFTNDLPGVDRIATVPDPGFLRFEKLGWLIRGLPTARRLFLGGNYDAVLTSSPPAMSTHTIGLLLKTVYGIPWVADYRDYTVDATIVHRVGRHRQSLLKWMERLYLNSADVVIGNTESAGRLFEESETAGEVAVLPNGADPSNWAGLEPLRGRGGFRMVHAGRFIKGRTPEPFFEGLKRVRKQRPDLVEGLVFSMVGPFSDRYNGPHSPEAAVAMAERFGVEDLIEVIGPVDHPTALRYMLGADALVLFNILGTQVPVIPAKLYEYMHMNRPIFAVQEPDCEADRLLQASGMGMGVASLDPEGIAADLERFLSRCRDGEASEPWVERKEVTHRYLSNNLAVRLDRLLRSRLPGRQGIKKNDVEMGIV
ncbi:MAG: glycosyltransferase [Verrucomicrobiota bacterium]|jgi:glycosyltransferase involved in cell wall biosynthesis|nr:glycosyltransferase [Verrucomicrobiota bacterium]